MSKFIRKDSSSDTEDFVWLVERRRTKRKLRFRVDCTDSSSDDDSVISKRLQVAIIYKRLSLWHLQLFFVLRRQGGVLRVQ